MSAYMNDNVNNPFRKEPDAEKPHVRICEGRTTVRGASTRPIKNPTVTVRKYESYRYEMVAGNIL